MSTHISPLTKPLTKEEFVEMLKAYSKKGSENIIRRGSLSFFYEGELELKKAWKKMGNLHKLKNITIYNVGVGGGGAGNVEYLLNFFRRKGIEPEIHTYEARRRNIENLVAGLKVLLGDTLPKELHFYEADMYLTKLEPEADILIGINIFPMKVDTWGSLERALFDNFVRGTKKGGYIIINEWGARRKSNIVALRLIDFQAYGLRVAEVILNKEGHAIIVLKRVKMAPILEF